MPPLTVTSDPAVDGAIEKSLAPIPHVALEALIKKAQEVIDQLKRSRFFRRYVEEKMEGLRQEKVLALAGASLQGRVEWLVITEDFQIKFMNIEANAINFFDVGDQIIIHELINRAINSLKNIDGSVNTMRFFYDKFGEPSFTIEEVQAERRRNGKVTIIAVKAFNDSSTDRESIIRSRLNQLQFAADISWIGYDNDAILEITEGEYIIFLDIAAENARMASSFFDRLTPAQRQRLWTTMDSEAPVPFFTAAGLPSNVTGYPGYGHYLDLSDDELLRQLDRMFADHE